MTGPLWFHLASAILMTAVVASIVVTWYRRSVTRRMSIAGSAPSEVDSFERELPSWRLHVPSNPRDGKAGHVPALRWRAAVVYGLGGLAASAVMTILFILAFGVEVEPIRIFAILYAYCWPIVPTLSFLLGQSIGRALLAFVVYAAVGALSVVILSALLSGRADAISPRGAVGFLQFLALQASLPFVIILATSGRRIRSIAPFALAGLLIFSFSNLGVGYGLVMAFDFAVIRDSLLAALGAFGAYNVWYFLAALPTGYACWLGLRWLGRQYERKLFSDAQLLVDAWWLIVTLVFAILLVDKIGWIGVPLGLLAFAAYRLVVAAGLALWQPSSNAWIDNRRLLLLRVFGFQRRTERLFDSVAQRWRWVGSVKIIAAADLATRLIGPGDLISFMGGRLRQLFVRRDHASLQRLGELDEVRDPDGRYRVNKVYCHQDSWQPALQALLATSDLVLMDLRGFSEKNQGCLFELQELVEQDRLRRTVFIVDDTTDTKLLKATLVERSKAVHGVGMVTDPSVKLISAKPGGAGDAARIHQALLEI
jgi:hypothetical protein